MSMQNRLRIFPFLPVLLWSLGYAQSGGEQASSTPLIRAEAGLVLVDTVVTDRKGNYLRDLKAGDFQVFEDGKEQTLKSVSPEQGEVGEHAAPQYMILLFDNSTMKPGDQSNARQQALKFVDSLPAGNRFVAIADFGGTLHITQNFTRDPAKLEKAIRGSKGSAVTPGDNPQGEDTPSLSAAEGSFGARNLVLALQSLADSLAAVPGRKTLVLLSSGFPSTSPPLSAGEAADRINEISATVASCAKARVVVYPVDVRGVVMSQTVTAGGPFLGGGRRFAAGVRRGIVQGGGLVNQQALFLLAEKTGGFVVHDSNDLTAGLESIAREESEFYILGYAPANAGEGVCHELRVKLNRPSATARARSSYCTVKSPDLLAGSSTEKQLEAGVAASVGGGQEAARVPLQASYFYVSPQVARVNLAMEIPPQTWKFRKEHGKFASELAILGVCLRADGSIAARFSDAASQQFDSEQEVAAFQQRPYRYENQFEILPGSYSLRVALMSGESVGRGETPLQMEALSDSKLAISAVVLSNQVVPARDVPSDVNLIFNNDRSRLLFDAQGHAATPWLEVKPSVTSQFSAGDNPLLYVEVYDPAMAESTPLKLALHFFVQDRQSGEKKLDPGFLNVSSYIHPGIAVVPIGLRLPIDKLRAGAYRVSVVVEDSAGNISKLRTTNFEIK